MLAWAPGPGTDHKPAARTGVRRVHRPTRPGLGSTHHHNHGRRLAAMTPSTTTRRPVVEREDDSVEELQARRVSARSPVADLDAPDTVEGFELPGAELADEEPTMTVVVPMRSTNPVAHAVSGMSPQPTRPRTSGARRVPRVRLNGGPAPRRRDRRMSGLRRSDAFIGWTGRPAAAVPTSRRSRRCHHHHL
jgi:hypothetical protein